jgi:hypothetical protein
MSKSGAPALDFSAERKPSQGRTNELLQLYITATGTVCVANSVSATAGCGRRERNHPAESQARGMTNSDQPQSRQTRMSGEGVMGG